MEQQDGGKRNRNHTASEGNRRQSSVLCWLLQLRKIPIYLDSWFCCGFLFFVFFPSFSCNWTRKQQDAHLQQRHGHELQRYAAKSRGVSRPRRAAVTGAGSRGRAIDHPDAIPPLISQSSLPISTGAEPGTETCSALRNITNIRREEERTRSPSSRVRATHK